MCPTLRPDQFESLRSITACGHRMAHRKWKETKKQPSMLPGPVVAGCCLVSFHFPWAILCPRAVQTRHDPPLFQLGYHLPASTQVHRSDLCCFNVMRSCVYLHCIAGGLRTLSGEGMFENLFYARSKKVLFPNKIFRSDPKKASKSSCLHSLLLIVAHDGFITFMASA